MNKVLPLLVAIPTLSIVLGAKPASNRNIAQDTTGSTSERVAPDMVADTSRADDGSICEQFVYACLPDGSAPEPGTPEYDTASLDEKVVESLLKDLALSSQTDISSKRAVTRNGAKEYERDSYAHATVTWLRDGGKIKWVRIEWLGTPCKGEFPKPPN